MRSVSLVGLALLAVAPAGAVAQTVDDHVYWKVLADELEYVPGPAERPVAFDASFWIGGDYNRVWIKAKGDRATVGSGGELEAQLLFSRLIAPFWELQAGLGIETVSGEDSSRSRGLAILGLEGLAPYWFEVEPQLLVSHEGDIAFALNDSYEPVTFVVPADRAGSWGMACFLEGHAREGLRGVVIVGPAAIR